MIPRISNNQGDVMALKVALLDIDGVIVLSEALHQEKIIQVAADPLMKGNGFDAKFGVHIDLDRDWNAQLAGIGDHRIYEWIKARNTNFPLSEADFLSKCEHYYLSNAKRLQLRESFREGFALLAQHELFIAAVSSGVRNQVDRNLEVAGIRERLIFAHSADDVEAGKTKPHPRPYLKALDELNQRIRELDEDHVDITPDECLVIEDTSSGAAAGLAAGMKVLHWTLNTGKYNPDAHYKLEPDDRLDTFLTHLLGAAPSRQNAPLPSRQPV